MAIGHTALDTLDLSDGKKSVLEPLYSTSDVGPHLSDGHRTRGIGRVCTDKRWAVMAQFKQLVDDT